MSDKFERFKEGLESPPNKAFEITPDDATDLDNVTRALYVGVSGDVAVILEGDSASVVFVGLAAGVWHPMQVKRVLSTGTSAGNIVGGY